ncbi:hypothetical protein EJA72_29350 [Pseudomonas sp. PB120]|uniref:DUF6555 family protein n=1 Tax=Pseudomonas sp. PB120 TaxID=2494700 RepID=UPI0012FE6D44|nr:DUF6555 family protein [Pseudomonas sp. PB120]MVV52306.1 hypothetical protein [Pseudomonas sp. PB120]
MPGLKHFQITYCLHANAQVFVQFDSHMSDEDAWYYACLHAGIGLAYAQNISDQSHATLREHAERCGLTEVKWRALP